VLEESAPLVLPVAHDALTARLIELAGYPAYQIGGFALVGSRFAYPDIDLAQFGENSAVMRDTIAASSLPVLVDADDAYGDAKNVTRVVQGYEAMGASAIFLEDQQRPSAAATCWGRRWSRRRSTSGKFVQRRQHATSPKPSSWRGRMRLRRSASMRRCAEPNYT
jgi:2-methylisocitrate lyase-like PEP mutase family enzyme